MKPTKKTILTSIFSLLLNCSFGQTVTFKTTYFDSGLPLKKMKTDTLKLTGSMDLDFYRKHFSEPYYYPESFINKAYNDTTVVKQSNANTHKDFTSNWTYTYVYDTLSRVTAYKYSGCMICSQIPFTIQIAYDEHNRPIKLEKYHDHLSVQNRIGQNSKENKEGDLHKTYELIYNANGEIIQMKIFKMGTLYKQIEKI